MVMTVLAFTSCLFFCRRSFFANCHYCHIFAFIREAVSAQTISPYRGLDRQNEFAILTVHQDCVRGIRYTWQGARPLVSQPLTPPFPPHLCSTLPLYLNAYGNQSLQLFAHLLLWYWREARS